MALWLSRSRRHSWWVAEDSHKISETFVGAMGDEELLFNVEVLGTCAAASVG